MMRQTYPTCVPERPIERENGYNIKVNITSKDKSPMSALGFECEFWLDGAGRKVIIGKFDMAEILFKNKPAEYFAQLYGSELGNVSGWLFCTIAIQQPDENWACGYRDVTIEHVFTGIFIGNPCGRMPRAPRHVCDGRQWHNGFKVSFEKVDYLPKSDVVEDEEDNGSDNGGNDNGSNDNGSNDNGGNNNGGNEQPSTTIEVRYGVIRGLSSFGAITESQISGFATLTNKQSNAVNVPVVEGDTLVILAKGCEIKKDDGIGGKVAFDTSIMGANGQNVTLNGVKYNVYGETFIVSGNVGFYIV